MGGGERGAGLRGGDKAMELQMLRDGNGEQTLRQHIRVSTSLCGKGKYLNYFYNI